MIVDLELRHCGTDLDAVFHVARDAGLDVKSSREVCYCWDMFQIWRDRIDSGMEGLKSLRHRSPPHDPPDVELVFSDKIIAFEHTRLQPEHLGHANALRHRKIAPDIATIVPPVSKPTKSWKKLIEIMLGIHQRETWTNVSDERAAVAQLLVDRLREKMIRLPPGAIIGIVDGTDRMDHELRCLFKTAEQLIRSTAFSDFKDFSLIILDRPNPHRYLSAFITRQDGTIIRPV